jgi:pyruvyl transferase EpsO
LTPAACVAALRAEAIRIVGRLLAGATRVALFDFPNYPNVGDSAIYLGQLALLRSLGLRPAFVCDFPTYDATALRHGVRDGIILLAGGGSFGDVWPEAHAFRERVVRDFPHNRIVQLPQTVYFASAAAARRTRIVLEKHRGFTLLVRDRRSLEAARRQLGVEAELCPDMAVALGPLERPAPAHMPLLWLSRTDKERASGSIGGSDVAVVDWLEEPWMALRELNYRLMGTTRRRVIGRATRTLLTRTYAPLARQRLHRGIALLSSGRVVITDRLHGHILSLLLGIPHVVLDNSYGKVSGFHDTWTSGATGVYRAQSAAEALAIARTLAHEHAPTRAATEAV